jgi:hypothetical protein
MTITSTDIRWRRVGSNIELQGNINYSATSNSQFRLSLPLGSVSSSITSTFARVGQYTINSSNSTSVRTFDLLGTANLSYLTSSHAGDYGVGVSPLSPQTTSDMIANATGFLSLQASIPIQGWGSSVAMSSDSGDGRVVVAIVKNLQSGKTTSNGFYWSTIQNDTHNSIRTTGSGSTQRTEFVAPLSGYYRVSCTVSFNNTGAVNIYKNSSVKLIELMYTTTANISQNLSSSVFLNAGDFIYIATSATYTSNSDSDVGFSIERISAGSQVIANVEGVSVICRTISNGLTATATGISWTSKEVDSHGAFTASSSRFTAPMSGVYQFDLCFRSSNGNSGFSQLYDVTNSVIIRTSSVPSDSSIMCGQLSSSVRLLAGQIIDIKLSQASGTSTLSSNLYDNYLSITRVGNY